MIIKCGALMVNLFLYSIYPEEQEIVHMKDFMTVIGNFRILLTLTLWLCMLFQSLGVLMNYWSCQKSCQKILHF